MIYHEIDLFILQTIIKSFENNEEIGTGDIARKWWKENKKFKSQREKEDYWRKKYDMIGKRLKIMSNDNLVFVSKNSKKNEYSIIKENVKITRTKQPDNAPKKVIWIKEKDNRWQSYEIR